MTQAPHTIAWDALELQSWPKVIEGRLADNREVEAAELSRHLHLYFFASRLNERAGNQRTSTTTATTTPVVPIARLGYWSCCSGSACTENTERIELAHVHAFLRVSLPSLLDSCQRLSDAKCIVPAAGLGQRRDGPANDAVTQQLKEEVQQNSAATSLNSEQWPQLLEMLFRTGATLHLFNNATETQRKEIFAWIVATAVTVIPMLLPELPVIWLRLIQLAIPAVLSLYYRCTTMNNGGGPSCSTDDEKRRILRSMNSRVNHTSIHAHTHTRPLLPRSRAWQWQRPSIGSVGS
jgi:hypothetical protein